MLMEAFGKQARTDVWQSLGEPGRHGHNLDPRTVLTALLSLAIWISSTPNLWVAMAWVLGTGVAVLALRRRLEVNLPSFRRILFWSPAMASLTVLLFLLLSLLPPPFGTNDGAIWLSISSGLVDGSHMALRLLAFVLLAVSMFAVSSPSALAAGVTRILCPLRYLGVPVEMVFHFSFFLFRMIPFLATEARTIRMAQASRGIKLEGRIGARVRASSALALPVFTAAGRRADQLAVALWARGFDLRRMPTAVLSLRLRVLDYIILGGLATGWVIWTAHFFGK
jgi:energy-coupling factor transport system permease protein